MHYIVCVLNAYAAYEMSLDSTEGATYIYFYALNMQMLLALSASLSA